MVKKTAKKSMKKDIPSAFDKKTGVDVGKGPKTMPTKGASKDMMMPGMPMKDKKMKGKMPMKKGKC